MEWRPSLSLCIFHQVREATLFSVRGEEATAHYRLIPPLATSHCDSTHYCGFVRTRDIPSEHVFLQTHETFVAPMAKNTLAIFTPHSPTLNRKPQKGTLLYPHCFYSGNTQLFKAFLNAPGFNAH